MAKNKNAFEKYRKEMEKKKKAQEKRERRHARRIGADQPGEEPVKSEQAESVEETAPADQDPE